MSWQNTTTTSPPWDLLPLDIVRKIFFSLWLGDRVRARLVCTSWKRILTQASLPTRPEAPWEILSNDSYSNPEPCLKEIHFRSLSEQRVYRFRLPPTGKRQLAAGWCFCGSSRGWLLIAGKETMFLWQPLSGDTRKLPSLSTLPYFNELEVTGTTKNLSSLVHRVEVFSMGRIECIVALILRRNNTRSEVVLCSPRDKTWMVLDGGDFELNYSDVLFHSGTRELHALATHVSPEASQGFLVPRVVRLVGCRIKVRKWLSPVVVRRISEAQFPLGLQVVEHHKNCLHLVESALTHRVMLVRASLDCVACEEGPDNEHDNIVGSRRHQTAGFKVGASTDTFEGPFRVGIEQLEILSDRGGNNILGSFWVLFNSSCRGRTAKFYILCNR